MPTNNCVSRAGVRLQRRARARPAATAASAATLAAPITVSAMPLPVW